MSGAAGRLPAQTASWLTRIAALFLPAANRSRYRDEWAAEIEEMGRLGISPVHLAFRILVTAPALGRVLGPGPGRAGGLRDAVADRLAARPTRFASRYRHYLLAELQFVDLRGLGRQPHKHQLADVYVDVLVTPVEPGYLAAGSGGLLDAAATVMTAAAERLALADLLGRRQPQLLAVIGAPGSGKTTMLRHAARELCIGPRRHRRNIAVLLNLRDHAAAITASPQAGLAELIRGSLARFGLREPSGWLERRLRAGLCTVMLDGLDEVGGQQDRQAVSAWVTAQAVGYPRCSFVVTSRPLGYQGAPIDGALALQVQPLTRDQAKAFVSRRFLAEEQHGAGADGQGLRDLAVSPLLLTMTAITYRYRGVLPGRRADLYCQICEALAWRRQDAKRLDPELHGEHAEMLLCLLAFEMMRLGVRSLTADEACTILHPAMPRTPAELAPRTFLPGTAATVGLLIEQEPGILAFAHLTFQEYLAAAHAKNNALQPFLAERVTDPWWRETILLYVSANDAGPIAEACLRAGTPYAIDLARECAMEAAAIPEETLDRLDQQLSRRFRETGNLR